MYAARLPVLLSALLGTACAGSQSEPPSAVHYVGSASCASCHATKATQTAGGAHALAMQAATAGTVSGRFDDAALTHRGVTSTFFTRDSAHIVRTDGAEHEITHIIGIHPLEQYIVRFRRGRYQVLPVAWDTRTEAEGGGRWFHVQQDAAVTADDELHWTGPFQTWNYMCAECHVTALRRNYDPATDAYDTSWRELGVQCESCHGPGSAHVAWAQQHARDSTAASPGAISNRGLVVNLRARDVAWVFEAGAAIARRSEPLAANTQAEVCGMCHARRETLVATYVPGRPLLDTHRPVLLDEGVYHPDGQLLDEVYEYGSFLQSRMYRAGVTCSDCHDPATQDVPPGNTACARCHRPDVFDDPSHHFHQTGSTGAACVSCHMPPRTYMMIQPRHDHSIRVPRPDVSQRIGTPNACTTCHTDRGDGWAAAAAARWWGEPAHARHYGDVIAAARRGNAGADSALIRVAGDTAEPAIVRATAVSLLKPYRSPAIASALQRAARDAAPLVRLAAAMTSDVLPPQQRLAATSHLLTDTLLAIRVEAARSLADIPDALLTADQRVAFDEFVAAQRVNADQPESHLRLGVFHLQREQPAEAERAYRDAIRIRPRYAGGYLNLADLYRMQARDVDGERVLRDGIRLVHRPAPLHHALGLLLVRRRALDEAVIELARAVELEPDATRFAHVYAVALHTVGRTREAITVLEDARRRAPDDPELRATLESIRGS